MHPHTGELEHTDICARLDVAVQQVYLHLKSHPEVRTDVEVSYDEDGELEGVGFFDDNHDMLSCVTVYHLERDTEQAHVKEVTAACAQEGRALEAALNEIFRN